MEQKESVPIVIFKEKLNKSEFFVAYCPSVDISSQGKTEKEAKQNIIEALTLYRKQPEPVEIFDALSKEVSERFRKKGIKKSEVAKAIRQYRGNASSS